jgi:hypothetical protein
VQIINPINLTERKKWPYTNIPQQLTKYYVLTCYTHYHDICADTYNIICSYSCGVFVMKYMLTWDGEKITDPFTQLDGRIYNIYMLLTILHKKVC